ncbi:MAG: translation elongation factor Ts [Alphaproteobacteria bacterium]|nr:translation elongation factor Ts [Alphaproteobacteria bacterium]
MADITASMVKELREKSGAGMMDAKKALVENEGDMEKAIDWLRTKGLAKAAKKSGRTAAEGLVALATKGTKGVVVEINSETDFVARNADFQAFVKKVSEKALEVNTLEELTSADLDGKSVADTLTDLIATIGEHMTIRRLETLEVSNGAIAGYMHGALSDNLGTLGVLVGLESSADASVLEGVGEQIAMHVAATSPQFLAPADVDSDTLNRERNVLKEQAIASGKPADIAEKMVEGRIRKFYEEICLTEQVFVIDGETKISDVVAKAAKDAGTEIKLAGFKRVKLGDGIEKEEEDFAAEVAAAANG